MIHPSLQSPSIRVTSLRKTQEVVEMRGGIYPGEGQRCPVCRGRFEHFEPLGVWCAKHPECRPKTYRVKFGKIHKRFSVYESTPRQAGAYRFLIGLRFKSDENRLDIRDYRKDQPLGFKNLAIDYIDRRKKGRGLKKVKCLRNLANHINYGVKAWNNRNIKDLAYPELEDFFLSLPEHLADKTVANIKTTLHAFWVWCGKRHGIAMPDFPVIEFTLGWRKVVDKTTQQAILDEIKRISYHINPKIWIGCRWLSTYISIRPVELIHIKEEDFRHDLCGVDVWYSKTGEPRFVPFLAEDMELAKSFGPSFPKMHFFRHGKRKGVSDKTRGRFGKDYLWKWCRQACQNLGIEEVSLYGITCHSSARALRGKGHTPEEIKRAMMRKTNAAFERYFQFEMDDVRSIYSGTALAPKKKGLENAKVLKLKDKSGAEGGI